MIKQISKLIIPFLTLFLMINSCGVKKEGDKAVYAPSAGEEPSYPYFNIPVVDLDMDNGRQTVVDKEEGQYLGHPTTVLLEDNKTMLCVYPKGHGSGGIVYKRSDDAGLTWSERLETPDSWLTSKEVPTIYRVIDAEGKRRIIMFSGLYPARMAVSEDDGKTWSELDTIGDWGGIVVTGALTGINTGKGHYMTFFHDDMRFFTADGQEKYRADREENDSPQFSLYQTISIDGGLSWFEPKLIYESREMHLCEPGIVRSPDGKQLAMLLRENSRRTNSQVMFSDDEGKTWSEPVPLPNALTGDRHVPRYSPDGRLVISFRDISPRVYHKEILELSKEKEENNYGILAAESGKGSPTEGDWVAWVGNYEDLLNGGEGQYRIRLKDNKNGWDTSYPGVEVLPDGTFVMTTYGHWEKGVSPYILSVRFKLEETDEMVSSK